MSEESVIKFGQKSKSSYFSQFVLLLNFESSLVCKFCSNVYFVKTSIFQHFVTLLNHCYAKILIVIVIVVIFFVTEL